MPRHPQAHFLLQDFEDNPPPTVLYHYTSLAGLIGILTNKVLWASSLKFLNDSSELAHGFRIIHAVVEHALRAASPTDQARYRFLSACAQPAALFKDDSLFATSLSTKKDLLSQWRGYTPPGAGYAVGFHSGMLHEALCRSADFTLLRCIYNEEEQSARVKAVLEHIFSPYENSSAAELGLLPPPELRFAGVRHELAATLKHVSFSEECEWRLVCAQPDVDKWHFRPGKHLLVPYLEIPINTVFNQPDTPAAEIPACAIHEIIVGPTPHPEMAKSSLSAFCSKHGASPNIRSSTIPYRSV